MYINLPLNKDLITIHLLKNLITQLEEELPESTKLKV